MHVPRDASLEIKTRLRFSNSSSYKLCLHKGTELNVTNQSNDIRWHIISLILSLDDNNKKNANKRSLASVDVSIV